MAISPAELPGYLRAIQARAAAAAAPAVNAMAEAYRDEVRDVTLQRYAHAPEEWTNSPPGQPPARVSGTLAGSVTAELSAAELVATATVAPHTDYAVIQEEGGSVQAHARTRGGWTGRYHGGQRGPGQHTLHYRVGGRDFFPMEVTLPARPYMRPTRDEMVADGRLRDAAIEGFQHAMWG